MNFTNMRSGKNLIAVALTALMTVPCGVLILASGAQAAGVGTTGAAFLKVGVGARALSMGNAAVAVVDDANAVNWNPAGLASVTERHASLSYNSLFKDQNQGFLGCAVPLKEGMGTMGLGVNYLIIADLEKRAGDTENPDSTFNDQNMAISLSYARPALVEGLNLGGNLKYVREALDSYTGNAVALDLGATYKTPVENLSVGGMLQNFGTKIGPDPLPMLVKTGAAYSMFEKKLIAASDIDWYAMDKRAYYDLGLEFWANRVLALRAGYQLGHKQDRLGTEVGLGAGIGLRLERFKLDYALVPYGDLGLTHRVTLGVRF